MTRAYVAYPVGAPPVGDAIFLSTDAQGTPGRLNTFVLGQLGLPTTTLPDADRLAGGYAILRRGGRLLCFIVTVTSQATTEVALRRNLELALRDIRIKDAQALWIPLMGNGDGGLSDATSRAIISSSLVRTRWTRREGVRIMVSVPPSPGAPTPARIPRSHAVDELLRLATELDALGAKPDGLVSTRKLLFALSLGAHPRAPLALAQDEDAKDFAAALAARTATTMRGAWDSYFGPRRAYNGVKVDTEIGLLTTNADRLLSDALSRAKSAPTPRESVETDDLVEAVLAASQGRLVGLLKTLGIKPGAFLTDYRTARAGRVALTLHNDVAADRDRLGYDSYADAITNFLTHAKTPPPLSISIQAPWGVGKSSLMQMVRNRLDPKVVRDRYRPKPEDPLALRLRDVLRFLDRNHRTRRTPAIPASRRWTVWFNAWKYETSEQVWAGLVDAIIEQVSWRLPPLERELFLLRLNLARVDDGAIRRRIYERVVNVWWTRMRGWIVSLSAIIVSALGLGAAKPAAAALDIQILPLLATLSTLGFPVAGYLSVFLMATALLTYWRSATKTHAEPAAFSLAEYLKVPDYGRALGSIHHIHADLLRVLSVVPQQGDGPSPLVIFIDDLDRCAPSKVAAAVEGVSTFLASDLYRCIFVIGMDPQMVAAALEEAHKDMRGQLPSFERAVPLGWRFMDKFIQLPFTIPPANRGDLQDYMNDLRGVRDEDELEEEPEVEAWVVEQQPPLWRKIVRFLVEAGRSAWAYLRQRWSAVRMQVLGGAAPTPAAAPSQGVAADAVAPFQESLDVGNILDAFKDQEVGNPRELKRLANMARFYLALRKERKLRDNAWTPPDPSQYARWIALTSRWPDMMRWLQWGADEAQWTDPTTDLIVRRLRVLEEEASAASKPARRRVARAPPHLVTWRDRVVSRLNLEKDRGGHWLSDPKLFEFFQKEAARKPGERLSDAASVEFW